MGTCAQAITGICRRYRVAELSVFGSAAGGAPRDGSDIDLLVEFEANAGVGLLEYVQLQDELAAVLGREVDLVSKSGLHPLIRHEILASREVIYATGSAVPV